MTGQLRAIWRKRAKRGPMDPQSFAVLVAGRGLEGNANQGGRRQVTILEEERWTEALIETGADLPTSARRANLVITGLSLQGTRGRILRIGPTRLQIWSECPPCERMDEAWPGLRQALRPHWRAGACAQVLEGGEIRVGDEVAWEERLQVLRLQVPLTGSAYRFQPKNQIPLKSSSQGTGQMPAGRPVGARGWLTST